MSDDTPNYSVPLPKGFDLTYAVKPEQPIPFNPRNPRPEDMVIPFNVILRATLEAAFATMRVKQ